MLKRAIVAGGTLLFAFAILFVSVLRTASVRYSFSSVLADSKDQFVISENKKLEDMVINYRLANPGAVLPDHIFWSLKALRDKFWLILTTNESKKAELNLLFADKRLAAAQILFEKGRHEVGFTTLTKAEKYLESACGLEEKARNEGADTSELVQVLIKASLKHRQVIKQILLIAPEDAKPKIILAENYARGVYGRKIHVLQEKGIVFPENPFNGE